MTKICFNCKKEYDAHTNDELLKCGLEIIQGVKDPPHLEPKICYFCNKEFEAHNQEDRDNCLKKFVDRTINL
ncbi:MAG TPA: hypothetical protein EYP96_02265 [Nitrosopumilus sp.]|jgi:hypothetical protein|nr:hypothetical protein [Nitrosopumilus sp.]